MSAGTKTTPTEAKRVEHSPVPEPSANCWQLFERPLRAYLKAHGLLGDFELPVLHQMFFAKVSRESVMQPNTAEVAGMLLRSVFQLWYWRNQLDTPFIELDPMPELATVEFWRTRSMASDTLSEIEDRLHLCEMHYKNTIGAEKKGGGE